MGFKLPKMATIGRNVLLTAISLVVLRAIGGAVPKLKTVPLIGAVFE